MAKDTSKSPTTLNLDTLERENTPDAFTVTLGGRDYELIDATECDYRELVAAQQAALDGEPDASIAILLREEDRDEFFANRLPSFKLEALFNRYNEHHGLPQAGATTGPSMTAAGRTRTPKRR